MNRWRFSVGFGAFAGIALLGAIAIIFQDNIARYTLNPKFPYQTYTPPPPPAYGARGAWALWPASDEYTDADVFYVHSTTYYGTAHWNAPLTDQRAGKILREAAAPNEAGPFLGLGNVYGPKYRQATLFASFTHKFDGRAAHELAYSDVRAAFKHFLSVRREPAPIVLVGYGQGGLHVLGLLQHYFQNDESLRRQLSVAYIVDHSVPNSVFDSELTNLPPCGSSAQYGCVVSYVALEDRYALELDRFRKRSLGWTSSGRALSRPREEMLCINPLTWTQTDGSISSANHVGAASATGLPISEVPAPIAGAISATCDRGILVLSKPKQTFLRRQRWFGSHWRAQDYNLFFHDLREDAVRRIELSRQAMLPPIDESAKLELSEDI